MSAHFVIVGGGQAAAQAVQTLRQAGFAGAVTVVGEEPHAPYQRPPLSKKYLAGEIARERLLIRPPSFYADKSIRLELGRRVERLDRAARRVMLDDGRSLEYDGLLLATGSRPRRLQVPGLDLAGVHYLRTLADVDAIQASLAGGGPVVLVGAGYIGLEAAAVLVQRGFDVTVLEAADRPMVRVVSPVVSAFYDECHRRAGVKLVYGATVTGFAGDGRVRAVECADGRSFPCRTAIIGIGIEPNVELARAAGLPCADGILVDRYARTEDPAVFAAGDCTNQPDAHGERRMRLESVPNAIHQAKVAAQGLLGQPVPYSEVPWFWSDQYDLKLQIAGLAAGHDEVAVRGDPAERRFAAYYLRDGRVIAVDAVNSPRDFLLGKKLIASEAQVSAAALRDPATDLDRLAG
ncbi:MAG TPA: FAD-dependent oxidoreductase [Gammaproteobacteria bacterium]